MADSDLILGEFRIERRLGAGGMGVVYLARQVSLNRLVALKSLGSPLTDDHAVARFRRAAQAAAKLRHPGIAAIYHIGQDDTACYVAMEYIDGASLDGVIRRLRTATTLDSLSAERPAVKVEPTPTVRFDMEETGALVTAASPARSKLTESAEKIRSDPAHIRRAVEIVRDAARALGYAHTEGVIHRDIKPGNLMLDKDGRVSVIDFGLARFFEDESVTVTGQLVGTPMYMSPEQVTGRLTLDARTDVYSLGLVLYELLTLAPPLTADNREQLLLKVVTKPLRPVRRANAEVSAGLEAVVHMATMKDPDARYATAESFAVDLERVLHVQPVTAKSYRFVADERELMGNRPQFLDTAAMALLFTAVVLVSFAVVIGGFGGLAVFTDGRTSRILPVSGVTGMLAMIGVLSYVVGKALLLGRMWALFGAKILCASVLAVSFFACIATWSSVSIESNHNDAAILAGAFFGLLSVTAVATWYRLRLNEIREWFRVVDRVRAGDEG